MDFLQHRILLLWGVGAIICFLATIQFVVLALRSRDWTLGLFSILCFVAGCVFTVDVFSLQIRNVPDFLKLDRAYLDLLLATNVAFLLFVHRFTGFNRRWISWPLLGLYGVLFVANHARPLPLFFEEVGAWSPRVMPWGEVVPDYEATLTGWVGVLIIGRLMVLVYALIAAIAQFRRGQRSSASVMLVGVAAIGAGFAHDFLLFAQASPPLPLLPFHAGDIPFVFFVLAMTFEMSTRVAEAARTKRSLVQTRADYRRLVEQAGDGFLVLSAKDGTILEANRRAGVMLGYSQEELTRLRVEDLVGIESPGQLGDLSATLRPDLPVTIDSVFRRRDGTTVPVEVRLGATVHDGTKLIVALARDVSERVAAEKERRSLESQVQRTQKMEAMGTLAGGIAHDFNNILTAVLGYTSLAREQCNGAADALLVEVVRAGERARDLVRQILTFSRPTSSELHPVSLQSTISETVLMLRATLPANVRIDERAHARAVVMADATQMQQVLLNLATNAAQAMSETGGTITIRVEETTLDGKLAAALSRMEPGPAIKLSVSDTGPGIPKDLQDRVFEPFFTTKPEGQGTGLGLSVVHGIVRQHGGDVLVSSTPGEGSCFDVLLPPAPLAEAKPAPPPTPAPRGTERVLVVDDESMVAGLLKRTLEPLGYEAFAFTSAREALDEFLRSPDRYDLVITDMAMPELTGLQLAREALRVRPDTPVILCSGFSAEVDAARALEMGVRAYLQKPFLPEELAGTVREVLDTVEAAK